MELKQLIREEIIKLIEEEQDNSSEPGIESTTTLTPLIKQLGDVDALMNKFKQAFKKIN